MPRIAVKKPSASHHKVAKGIVLTGKGGYKKKSVGRPKARGRGKYDIGDASDSDIAWEGGKRLAKAAIKYIPKLLGFGEYVQPSFQVKKNTVIDALGNNSPPTMESTRSRSQVIRHREYLGDIITSATAGAFNLQSFPINAGLENSFPWLAALAQNFQEYRFNGMIWEFKSTSADALNSTNTALGTIILATNYDSVQANFTNKQQMENCEFASSCKQSCSALHPIECDRTQTPVSELFVRTGAVPSGQDQRFYDMGNFQIATVGQQGTSVNVGELWVSYEVEFFKPILSSTLGLEIYEDHWKNTVGITNAAIFGTSPVVQSGSSLGLTLAGNVLTFPAQINSGRYLINYSVQGSSVTLAAPTLTYAGCSANTNFPYASYPGSGQTTTSVNLQVVIDISAASGVSATVTFSTGTLPSSATAMILVVTQLNGSVN